MFKWKPGRQGTGYKKICLWSMINFDIYVLKFDPKVSVPGHYDKVPGKDHHRLNIWLYRPSGGQFWTSESQFGPKKFYGRKRIIHFRPDIQWHGMYEVIGSRSGYVLSIGWTKSVY